MKRIIALLLFVALFCCAGCQQYSKEESGLRFYYCVSDLSYKCESAVISYEVKSGFSDEDLDQIMSHYLTGPMATDLRSPFPEGLSIISTECNRDSIYVTVSSELCLLTDIELTLACACLALTCFELTPAERIIITPEEGLLDGQRSITMDKNTLLLTIVSPE